MTTKNECLIAALAALNSVFELFNIEEIDMRSSLSQHIRFYIENGDSEDYASRPATAMRNAVSMSKRKKVMRSKFPAHGMATTRRGEHLYLVGFDENGFAVCESFHFDRRNNTISFSDALVTLPVQTSLSSCTIVREFKSLLTDDDLTIFYELCCERRQRHYEKRKDIEKCTFTAP